ncbi:MAG: hypothetical protein LBC21_03935, partial [Oscillospiraceae bacterium]|nr:hypothetical protein [Oscillospiraceae bacterium]
MPITQQKQDVAAALRAMARSTTADTPSVAAVTGGAVSTPAERAYSPDELGAILGATGTTAGTRRRERERAARQQEQMLSKATQAGFAKTNLVDAITKAVTSPPSAATGTAAGRDATELVAAKEAYDAAKAAYDAIVPISNDSRGSAGPAMAPARAAVDAAKKAMDEAAKVLDAKRKEYGLDTGYLGYALDKLTAGTEKLAIGIGSGIPNLALGAASKNVRNIVAPIAGALGAKNFANNALNVSGDVDKLRGEIMSTAGAWTVGIDREINDKYAEDYMPDTKKGVGMIADAIGGQVPAILANAAVPGLGLAAMGAGAAGNATAGAMAQGAGLEDATRYGILSGGVEVGTELLGGALIKGAGAIARGVAGKAGPRVAAAATKLAAYLDRGITSALPTGVRNLAGAAGEGVEEAVSAISDPFLLRLSGVDPEAALDWSQVATDAGLGAVIGAVLGGAGTLASMGATAVDQNRMTTQIMREMGANAAPTGVDAAAYAGIVQGLEEKGLSNANKVRLGNALSTLLARAEAAAPAETSARTGNPQIADMASTPARAPESSRAQSSVASPNAPQNGAPVNAPTDMARRVIDLVGRATVTDAQMDAAAQILEDPALNDVDRDAIADALLRAQQAQQLPAGRQQAQSAEQLETARPAQLPAAAARTLGRLVEVTGVKINYVEGLQAPEGASDAVRRSGINAWYDPATREINLNASRLGTDGAILAVAMHEMTHDIQESDPRFHREL